METGIVSVRTEIEAYAAKLVLLHHWRRILAEKQQINKEPIY